MAATTVRVNTIIKNLLAKETGTMGRDIESRQGGSFVMEKGTRFKKEWPP
jgi:hypothetical protein